jgi:hypothetical protein
MPKGLAGQIVAGDLRLAVPAARTRHSFVFVKAFGKSQNETQRR